MSDPNLVRFRSVVAAALAELEARRQEVNDLNVFPVADGDTGDNMVLTLRAVLVELDRLAGGGDRTIDEIGREEIVESVARAALLGARGNSGVILSQLIRGAAEELASRPGELVDPVLIGAALAKGSDRAYQSVRDPAEGTILTVAREMAHRIVTELAHTPEARQSAYGDPTEQNEAIAAVLERAVAAGRDSVERTPDLLPVLREAGVVDAGGHALTVIFAGIVAALRGAEPPPLERRAPARVTHPEHQSSTYRFCTNFAVTGHELEPSRFHAPLETLGDSVLVVGDAATLKVHLHTDDPETAMRVFDGVGDVSRLDVADMRAQIGHRAARLAGEEDGAASVRTQCGALAVVAGEGMRELYESLGVHALDGGATLNPSTYELLAGIHEVPSEEVVVLPNSPNVIMAAERAAELSDKRVRVVASRSPQAGLAVAVALDTTREAEHNAKAMEAALGRVRTGAVAPAARDDGQGRFREGEAVGFVDDDLCAWGAPEPTLRSVLEALAGEAELVTCLAGDQPPLGPEQVRSLMPAGVELEYAAGGQPRYWWLLAAE
ncbi:MAG: DAK2 domain-containing protein [Actinobacteria bacterium]|nr:MAG: DAK2 domain-containing protein [Actinomycetota bacterium]